MKDLNSTVNEAFEKGSHNLSRKELETK